MTAIMRAVLSISAANVLSRVTGYGRTMAQASLLGTGITANAYAISGALPNQIYELFLGGILYSIFIPLLVDRLTTYGEEDAQRLTSALLTIMLPLLAAIAILGVIFAEPLLYLTTDWGDSQRLSPEEAQRTTDLAVFFFRVFVLQIVFYGLGNILTGVLNSHRRFFLPNMAPVIFNLIVIASFGAYALLTPRYPTAAVYLLAACATGGVVVMYGMLLPAVWRLGYKPRLTFVHPALLPAAKLAGPMVVLVAASVGLQAFANFLATRYDAAVELYFAFVVFSLPYGVLVVSIATALMPELSEKHARGDLEGYRDTLSFGLRTTVFVMVPATAGLVALATPAIGLLYERGRFGPQDTAVVADLLVAYSVGLLGYAIYYLLVRAFFSRQNTRWPAMLNVGLLILYVALAYALSSALEVVGVALALSGANAVLALAGLWATRVEIKRLGGRRLLRSLTKILTAGVVMYAVAWTGTVLLGNGSNALDRTLILAVVGGASLAAYLGTAYVLKTEELGSAIALLKSRVGRNREPEAP